MPHAADTHAIVSLQHAVVLHLLPVPEPYLAVDVSRHHPMTVGGEPRRDRVACVQVTLERLLAHELEPPKRLVADDLVVQGLPYEILLLRVHHDAGHRVHRRLRDVLHHHRDPVLPDEDLLVVRRGHEPLALLAEGHGVDGTKMLVVLLDDGCRVGIPLHRLLVRTTGDDDVLLGRVGVDGDAEGRLLVGERRDDLAGLCVPELDVLVKGYAVKPPAVGREVGVADGLVVAHVGAEALTRVVVVPDLDLRVHARREQEVGSVREPADLLNTHRVAGPRVDPLLGEEALALVHVPGRLGTVLYPRAPRVVRLLRAMEDRGDPLLRLALLPLDSLLLLLLAGHFLLPRPHLHLQLPPDGGLVREAAPLRRGVLLLFVGRRLPLLLLLLLRSLLLHDRLLGAVARGPPLCLVPDGPALLRDHLRGQQPLLALGHMPRRICGVPKVVEGVVLLVKRESAQPRLRDVAELVVDKLVL
mmetsp:Transcript_70684/g.218583  ORF Transcript_70684/g.218583 Transcript_70684/m.218583 type:complete len:472 (+) Transcript_70684:292-1707(+)